MTFLDDLAGRLEQPLLHSPWAGPLDLAYDLNKGTRRTPALKVIDQHLVWAATTPDARLVISMPPQEGKSQLASRAFPLWLLSRNPETRVVIASYEANVARRMSRMARDDLTQNPEKLRLRIRPDVSSQAEWQLAGHQGGMYAVGVGGALTSRPADALLIDDPVKNREQADSVAFRERAWDWWTDTASTRLAPGAPAIVILTRWAEDDLAGRLLAEDETRPVEERRWRVLRIPAQCDDPATDPLGRELGEYMESARGLTVQQWEAKKGEGGARRWAALYQGRPAPLEGGIFKREWIEEHRIGPDAAPHLQRIVVAVDPTGGGHDEAGIIVAGRAPVNGKPRTFVLADHSGNYTAGDQWRRAWLAVVEHEADVLVYESNLVDPVMRRAIVASWSRMHEQAGHLSRAGLRHSPDEPVHISAEVCPHLDRLVAIAERLAGTGDDDVRSSDNPPMSLAQQLHDLMDHVDQILADPETGNARVLGVKATRGKTLRAEPVAAAYNSGVVHHVGHHWGLEQQMLHWQEGQDSPDRLDALVHAWAALNQTSPATTSSPAGSRRRVPRGPQVGAPRLRR